MRFLRKPILFFLCFLLFLPLTVSAAMEPEEAIVRDLIAYYFHYREEAGEEIDNQLQTLASLDPKEGELWEKIMEQWRYINEEMPINKDCLPDGLPADDSLCIVVLGYGLENDGDMKPELLDRLKVALASAEKYPQSYVLCTGGETAQVPGISEAGQMGTWLLANGLAHERLITEEVSLSTTENARNSLALLWRDYPQIQSLALVTSDYHIRWGMACFSAMALKGAAQGKPALELVGNGACATASPNRDTMYSQAWGISIIMDLPFDSSYVPTLYMTDHTMEAESPDEAVLPSPAAEPAPAAAAPEEPVLPVLLGLTAVLAVLFLPKKRNKSGSD